MKDFLRENNCFGIKGLGSENANFNFCFAINVENKTNHGILLNE